MTRPSREDAQAGARENQRIANELREQGRLREASWSEQAAQEWRDYLIQITS